MTPILSLYLKARMAFANHLNLMKRRDDRGAGFVEYAGVLVLVAAIATLLITNNPIGNAVQTAVSTGTVEGPPSRSKRHRPNETRLQVSIG